MKRFSSYLAAALTLALAAGAVAGDKKKCEMDPADCKAKMKAKIAEKAWLGVELDKNDGKKMVVTKVVPDSPAAKAGFSAGDVFVALNGIDYYTKDEVTKKKMKKARAQGHEATFTVLRGHAKKDLQVQFGKVPKDVAKKWVVAHMEEHHSEAKKTASKDD